MKILCELKKCGNWIRIHEDGGMVTGEFDLGGKWVNPFYSHPWPEYTGGDLLGFLKGDFVCVPFGNKSCSPIPGYAAEEAFSEKEYPHGYSSNGKWELQRCSGDSAEVVIRYTDSVVDRVEREIAFLDGKKGISIKNRVAVKENTRLPIGAHPIFRLPEKPGMAKLTVPKTDLIHTYPVKTDETSILKTNATASDIRSMPLAEGGSIDLTSLPLAQHTEEVLMLAGAAEGRVCLENYEEGYRAVLEFDYVKVPNFLLWISNRGRQFAPWNGCNLCLGIEPVVSAFDFGTAISRSDNALAKQGVKTCVSIEKDVPFTFDYQIYIENILRGARGFITKKNSDIYSNIIEEF
ncbi:MAG: hypothetical protein ACOX8N_10560 [Christensenellales bacterium]|jgi:hypothetical protein